MYEWRSDIRGTPGGTIGDGGRPATSGGLSAIPMDLREWMSAPELVTEMKHVVQELHWNHP
jgi:hypothetical protein